MLQSELITHTADQDPHLCERDLEMLVRAMLDQTAQAPADDDRVELRDFSTFSTRVINPRTGRNAKTGAAVEVKTKAHVKFWPGKAMRARLNRADVHCD